MRCYRYMDYEYGLQAFETGLFKVTKPSEFNDPYDCYGLVTGNLREEVLERFVRDNFARLCVDHENAIGVPREVFDSPDKMLEWYRPRFGRAARQQIFYRQIFDQHLRVLCFSAKEGLKPESDALMWSHYANGGFGVRIELEIAEEAAGIPYGLRRVNYLPTAPKIDLGVCNRWPESDPFHDFFMQCIWTKGETWKYENEARLICSPQYPVHVVAPMKCKDGVVRDFVRFHVANIKGLVFGPKVRPECWIKYYTRYCKSHPDSSVVFERAFLETDRYCYGYENLEQSMMQVVQEVASLARDRNEGNTDC